MAGPQPLPEQCCKQSRCDQNGSHNYGNRPQVRLGRRRRIEAWDKGGLDTESGCVILKYRDVGARRKVNADGVVSAVAHIILSEALAYFTGAYAHDADVGRSSEASRPKTSIARVRSLRCLASPSKTFVTTNYRKS